MKKYLKVYDAVVCDSDKPDDVADKLRDAVGQITYEYDPDNRVIEWLLDMALRVADALDE